MIRAPKDKMEFIRTEEELNLKNNLYGNDSYGS